MGYISDILNERHLFVTHKGHSLLLDFLSHIEDEIRGRHSDRTPVRYQKFALLGRREQNFVFLIENIILHFIARLESLPS